MRSTIASRRSVRRAASTMRAPRSAKAIADASPIAGRRAGDDDHGSLDAQKFPLVRWWCLGRYRSSRQASAGARRALGGAPVPAGGAGTRVGGRRGRRPGGAPAPQRVREHPDARRTRSRQALRALRHAGAVRVRGHRSPGRRGIGRADRRARDGGLARHRCRCRPGRVRTHGGAAVGGGSSRRTSALRHRSPGRSRPAVRRDRGPRRGARSSDRPAGRGSLLERSGCRSTLDDRLPRTRSGW